MLGDKFNLHCCFEFEYLSSVNAEDTRLIVSWLWHSTSQFFRWTPSTKKLWLWWLFISFQICRMERTTSSKKINPFETMFFHSRRHSRWGDSCWLFFWMRDNWKSFNIRSQQRGWMDHLILWKSSTFHADFPRASDSLSHSLCHPFIQDTLSTFWRKSPLWFHLISH